MFAYDPHGVFHSFPSILQVWHDEASESAAINKEGFLTWKRPPIPVRKLWPIPCINLLLAYQAFLLPFVRMKADLGRRSRDDRKDEAELLTADFSQHYNHVLQLFDEAIVQLNAPESTWKLCYETYSSSSSDSKSLSALQRTTPLKRAAEEYPVDQPPAKRSVASPWRISPVPQRSPRNSPVARSL
jgi:hypothetical protein